MLQLGEEHSCKTDKSGNDEDISSAFGDIQLITIKYMSLTVASTFYSVTVASTFAPAGSRYFGCVLVHFLFKLFVF